jgi:hypothetical protein
MSSPRSVLPKGFGSGVSEIRVHFYWQSSYGFEPIDAFYWRAGGRAQNALFFGADERMPLASTTDFVANVLLVVLSELPSTTSAQISH